MKPHLYRHKGWWWCCLPGESLMWATVALSPSEAYRLWKRSRTK